MISKPIDAAITKDDIEDLIANQVRELRHIEYKLTLPGGKDDDKKEFLADVSSFANAGGGDLIYGIEESGGYPTGAVGVSCNLDQEILRLESMIRTGIEPRIIGFKTQPIEGFLQGPVLIIRIPRSWSGPHLVSFKNSSRFFTRSSNGKYQMDVTEIRSAFLLSNTLPQKIRQFRDDRLGKIIAGETPVPLRAGAKLVLHVLPLAAFTTESSIDILSLKDQRIGLQPLGSNLGDSRYNLDGFLTYTRNGDGSGSRAYCQIFRVGQIESVSSDLVGEFKGRPSISSVAYEEDLLIAVQKYLGVLKTLEVPCPHLILISMLGVRSARTPVDTFMRSEDSEPIDRDTLILPDILIEEYQTSSNQQDAAKKLRPVFDAVWNACGLEHSLNFDGQGNWKPK